MSRRIPVEYRDPETTWDETHDGDNVSFPETFVVCTDCGVAVYDTEAHDDHHNLLNRLKKLLS